MKVVHITPNSFDLYFEYIQNDCFEDYINPTVTDCKWYRSNFDKYEDYCLTLIIEGENNIVGQLLVARFEGEKDNFVSYIWTAEQYRNKGLAKQMLRKANLIIPINLSSGFSEDGFNYLRNIYKELDIFFEDRIKFP